MERKKILFNANPRAITPWPVDVASLHNYFGEKRQVVFLNRVPSLNNSYPYNMMYSNIPITI